MPRAVSKLFKNPLVQVLFISLSCFIVYSNSFECPFILDDHESIRNNAIIRDLNNFLAHSRGYEAYPTRYVGYLTFALNYRLGGLDVTGYHVFNIVIHILNALLIYDLILLTFRSPTLKVSSLYPLSRSLSFLGALIFAVHPLQTEAVTYIVQRVTSLATLFYVLSVCLYARARIACDARRSASFKVLLPYILSLIAAFLSMKTKEIAITLPIMILFYELFFFKGALRERIYFIVPVLLIMFVIPLSLLNVQEPLGEIISDVSDVTRVQTNVSRADYFMTQFCVIGTYIRLLFFPYGQNLDYNYPIYHSFLTPRVFLSFILLVAVFGTAILMLLKSREEGRSHLRLISYGILWFFVTLSVESSIIPIVDVIFEHRAYLPSIGAILAAVVAVGSFLFGHPKGRYGTMVTLSLFVIVLGFSLSTFKRNIVWRSPVSMWEDVIRKSPGKARPLSELGMEYAYAERHDEAALAFVRAIQTDPRYVQAYNNLGITLSKQGMHDDAEKMFLKAIRARPDFPVTYHNLGCLYLIHKGEYDLAIAMFNRALELKPGYADAVVLKAAALNQRGDFRNAVKALENDIPLSERTPEAHYSLGVAYAGLGQTDAAVRQLEILRKIDPGLASRLERNLVGPRGVRQ